MSSMFASSRTPTSDTNMHGIASTLFWGLSSQRECLRAWIAREPRFHLASKHDEPKVISRLSRGLAAWSQGQLTGCAFNIGQQLRYERLSRVESAENKSDFNIDSKGPSQPLVWLRPSNHAGSRLLCAYGKCHS